MENKTTKQLKKELRIAEVIAKAKEEERKIKARQDNY